MTLALKTFSGRVEFECPEESVGLLEGGAASVDLVHKVLNTVNAVFAQVLVNDTVFLQAHSLLGSWLANLG